jgi:hypothetical protein
MNRAELYALVWGKPVTHVAKEFGISDVAIRKICIKHGIPTPPMGYWARLQHGKKVVQTSLPPPKPGQGDQINLHVRPKSDLPLEVADALRVAEQEESRPENRISVPTARPAILHPLAAASEKALRKAKPDSEGFINSQGAGKLDVHIGPASIDRVILLIHAMLHAATERGHQLSSDADFRIVVDEQPLAVRIYETKDKTAHVPIPAELKRQAEEDAWKSKYTIANQSNHMVYPTWDYFPSGRLVLEVSDPNQARWKADPIVGRWRDRSSKNLEDYLSEIMAALKTGGTIARHQRAKEAEEARLEKEAEERRREQEKQRRLLKKVTAFLVEKADKYAELTKVEILASYLAKNSSDSEKPDGHDELDSAMKFVLANLRIQLTADSVNQEIIKTRLLEPESWW